MRSPFPRPRCFRLLAAESAARERARLELLDQLYAARTQGYRREAESLLECGRILADESAEHGRRAALPHGVTAGRWASHICRELRRNRFAAHRGAMRRNVVPARAPTIATTSTTIGTPLLPPARQGRMKSRYSPKKEIIGRSLGSGCGGATGGDREADARSVMVSAAGRRRPRAKISPPVSPGSHRGPVSPLRGSASWEGGHAPRVTVSAGGVSVGAGSAWSGRPSDSPTRWGPKLADRLAFPW